MSSRKIAIQLTQNQREHIKMLTGFGPAKLVIEIGSASLPLYGVPWLDRLTTKAIKLNPEQRAHIKSVTGQNCEYLTITKASVEKWMRDKL